MRSGFLVGGWGGGCMVLVVLQGLCGLPKEGSSTSISPCFSLLINSLEERSEYQSSSSLSLYGGAGRMAAWHVERKICATDCLDSIPNSLLNMSYHSSGASPVSMTDLRGLKAGSVQGLTVE